jgi:LysM repeat protein
MIKPMKSATVQGVGNDHGGADLFAPMGTPIYAIANGKITYSEYGHTVNTGKHETPYSVKILLDQTITYAGTSYPYVYYTHMQSNLVYNVGSSGSKPNTISVKQGQVIGYSGTANNSPHLHLNFFDSTSTKPSNTTDTLRILGLSRGEKWSNYVPGTTSTPSASTTPSSSTTLTVSVSASKTRGTTSDKFNFFATTNVTASKVTLQFNGNSTVYQMSSSDKKNWSLNGNTLNAGSRTVTITAYDANGKTATKTLSVTVSSAGTTSQSSQKTYVVVRGDTLSGIGAKFGVKWQSIASANNIAAPNYTIYPGQKLAIPAA